MVLGWVVSGTSAQPIAERASASSAVTPLRVMRFLEWVRVCEVGWNTMKVSLGAAVGGF